VLPIRTVLHPTDFSEPSRPTFELACAVARDYEATVLVLHVVPWPAVGVADGVKYELPTGRAEETETRLRALRPADPRVRIDHRLERGEAAAEILRVAAEAKADLIVLGTHGRSGLSRLLMGSVAEDVLRKAPCPVLTVKTPPRPERSGHRADEQLVFN
jgi:nucleotide-binding universal stress UspA family protein